MNRELREFVKDALDKGHSRDTIRGKLLEAGWTDIDVTASLHSFAPVDFSIAVPRPRPYLYAREAFLYMVSFIALYVSAISFAILVFGLVDYSFPDALDTGGRYPSSEQATAIASVIVAFPLFLFLTRWLAQQANMSPERRQSPVRRWLTYITLVVAAGVILGDLIAILANLLGGDPTLRFSFKAGAILLVTACIFGYYIWDMRQAEVVEPAFQSAWPVRLLLPVVVVTVVSCIAYALFLIDSPWHQREIRLDEDRIAHLSNIADNVNLYWELNGELPAELNQLAGPPYDLDRIRDRATGASYEYRGIGGRDYELCAVFSTSTEELAHPSGRNFSERVWDHSRGRNCFQLQAQAPRGQER